MEQFHRYEIARREQGLIKQINQFQRQWEAQNQDREQLAAHGQAQRETELAQASARLHAQQQAEAERKLAQEAQNLLLRQQAQAQRLADQQRHKALVEAQKEVKARQRWATKGESPIEIQFKEAWKTLMDTKPEEERITLIAQCRIGKFRVDFAHVPSKTIVELDGHTYHSSRKDRNRDYQRQHELEDWGWFFKRFTGSQIYADVNGCVERVYKVILERMAR